MAVLAGSASSYDLSTERFFCLWGFANDLLSVEGVAERHFTAICPVEHTAVVVKFQIDAFR